MNDYVVRAGKTADGPFSLVVTPETAGWAYSSLRVLELAAGGSATFDTGEDEMVVLPLSGGCTVECDGKSFEVTGRRSVFSRVSDFAYVPRDAHVTVSSTDGGRFALPAARATRRLTARYGPAEGVSVELRGAGQASRQVNNFCNPQTFEADKLIAVEVLTPGANWSSYPPHKHDDTCDVVNEEVYYFRVAGRDQVTPSREGFALHRTYTDDGAIDEDVVVRDGDVFLVPRGYHGPCVAAPGYPLYYLNVLAGPGPERSMAFCDDPAHGWVRDTWRDRDRDPRCPVTTADGRRG